MSLVTIAQALVHRATRERPDLADRLARALRIVSRDDQPIVVYQDGTATVRSERDPEQVYRVHGSECDCPDAVERKRVCKHGLAAGLYKRAQRELADERQRQRDYGRAYIAPGSPYLVARCPACWTVADLSGTGLCRECAREDRWLLSAVGEATLHLVSVA